MLEGERTRQDSVRVPETGDLVRGCASASPAIGRADGAARAGWRFAVVFPAVHLACISCRRLVATH